MVGDRNCVSPNLASAAASPKRHWGLNRDPAMKETIRQMYVEQGMTVKDIASVLGVGTTSVSRFKKEFDIQTRTRPSEVGNVHGRWTVLSESRAGGRGFNTICHCRCVCGKTGDIPLGNLRHGLSQSCGCLHLEMQSLAAGESMRHELLREYKGSARNKGHCWELTDEQATTLFNTPCHYCGSPPSKLRQHGRCNGGYWFNGIDRQDNALGYTLANSVSACVRCNMMKRCRSVEDFTGWAQRVTQGGHTRHIFPVTEDQASRVHTSYRKNAESRKHPREFDLSVSDVRKLIQASCTYCGAAPSNTRGDFRYSGIDRRDNTLGYFKHNCQSACADCNRAKNTLSEEDFLAHVRRIADYQQVSISTR